MLIWYEFETFKATNYSLMNHQEWAIVQMFNKSEPFELINNKKPSWCQRAQNPEKKRDGLRGALRVWLCLFATNPRPLEPSNNFD